MEYSHCFRTSVAFGGAAVKTRWINVTDFIIIVVTTASESVRAQIGNSGLQGKKKKR